MRKCENERVPRPQFTIALKESIYVEYGVDLYNEQPLNNIIESDVIEEIYSSIPVHARYEFKLTILKNRLIFMIELRHSSGMKKVVHSMRM